MTAYKQKKMEEARQAIEAAVKADPRCQMAHFWRGVILCDTGDLDEGLKSFETTVELEPISNLAVVGAVRMGVILGRLKRLDEAKYWLSRAILGDPTDTQGQHWMAYRNMAVALSQQQRHYSAAVAALLGRAADPDEVPETAIREFAKHAGTEEVARVLHLEKKLRIPAAPPGRSVKTRLAPVNASGAVVDGKIKQLLPDPQGRYVVAVVPKTKGYYLIHVGKTVTVGKVDMPHVVHCACLAAGRLFLAVESPPRLVEVAVETGKALKAYPLGNRLPTSIAVLPSRRSAYYTFNCAVFGLDMRTGRSTATELSGVQVHAHPGERYVFSFDAYKVNEDRGMSFTFLVRGQPVFVEALPDNPGWSHQCVLVKSVAVRGRLLIAEVRENATTNPLGLAISPNGDWVAPVGGGGWRSPVHPKAGGYTVPVYAAGDLRHVQGVYHTGPRPRGFAFNPVTGQVAAVRNEDARVYLLAGGGAQAKASGAFAGACAWSGDGRLLILANEPKGLSVYENTLSNKELVRSAGWWKELKVSRDLNAPAAAAAAPAKAELKELAAFEPKGTREVAEAAVARAVSKGRTERLPFWNRTPEYTESPLWQQMQDIIASTQSRDAAGVRAYRLKEALKRSPDYAPMILLLADAQQIVGKHKEAEANLLRTIR
ncbi:MAG: tetratricopeptide repeat protein, partial [Planctomycetota bacterium]